MLQIITGSGEKKLNSDKAVLIGSRLQLSVITVPKD